MASLLLGPLLRYVGRTQATIWVETDRPCRVTGARAPGADVRGRRPPLRAGGARRPARGRGDRVHGRARRRAGLAAAGRRARRRARSTPGRASTRRGSCSGRAASARRSASRTRCRRTRTTQGFGVDALWAYSRRLQAGIEPWPDGLLLIGDQVYADEVSPETLEFIRVAPRRVAAARRGGRRLRGVHPAVPRGVDRPGHPLAAVDRAQRDGVRRPRRDRRLEHLVGVGRRTPAAQPWWDDRITGRVHVVLDLPAPGQPGAARARRRSRCSRAPRPARTSARRCGGRRDRPTATRRRRAGPATATSAARGCWSSTRAPPACWRTAAATWSTTASGSGSASTAAATSTTWSSSARCRCSSRPACTTWRRGTRRSAPGAWGGTAARLGERLRRALDLEHWPAFQRSFERMMQLLRDVASGAERPPAAGVGHAGRRGRPQRLRRRGLAGPVRRQHSRVHQLVCSPFRNPLGPAERRVVERHQDAAPPAALLQGLARLAGVQHAVRALALPGGPDVRQLDRHHRAGRPPRRGDDLPGGARRGRAARCSRCTTACWRTGRAPPLRSAPSRPRADARPEGAARPPRPARRTAASARRRRSRRRRTSPSPARARRRRPTASAGRA